MTQPLQAITRSRFNFDAKWRFRKGEPEAFSCELTYAKLRPWLEASGRDLRNSIAESRVSWPMGEPCGSLDCANLDFDDSAWRGLDLPHDWGIEGPFDMDLPGDTGKLPWAGVGWYRKNFAVSKEELDGRTVELEFDGAMSHATVWVNGRFAGGWVYGYSTFRVDVTDFLRSGEDNIVAVRLNNLPSSSRWYPGGGLYRHVWLCFSPRLRFAPWGIQVTTPKISKGKAWVQIDMVVEQLADTNRKFELYTELYKLNSRNAVDENSEPVARSVGVLGELFPLSARQTCRSHVLVVDEAQLWEVESPELYLAVSQLIVDGELLDQVETRFGIRTVEFNADNGLLLNGTRVVINGVCQHHDLGALGAAVNTSAIKRQLLKLREMGCNAIRTAHNPPAPEFLDLCDEMGFLVMDESFDCWRIGKRANDYGQYFDDWSERDMRAMVRRDRNHPSIILWSIGNEVMEMRVGDGWKVASYLAAIVHEEDKSRAITMGCSIEASVSHGYQKIVDVIGYNYKPWAYADLGKRFPLVPVYGSETSSCVSSRGEYFFPVSQNKAEGKEGFHVSSYDLYAPPWAWSPDREFEGLDESPRAAGEFVWTGFDYLGEPTPFNADASNLLNFSDLAEKERMAEEMRDLEKVAIPSRSSYFGILDLAGFRKDRFYLYQARWMPDLPVAHLLPHWNWPDRIGQVTPVHLYTNGDEAELFLNGRSQGVRRKGPEDYRLVWEDVVYEPGELKVVVKRNGDFWAESNRNTTGEAVKLELVADTLVLGPDLAGRAFVEIRALDSSGLLVPDFNSKLSFSVEGPVRLVAVDNGDPTSHRSFQGNCMEAFNGLALAILGPQKTGQGKAVLTVICLDIPAVSIELEIVGQAAVSIDGKNSREPDFSYAR